MSQKCILTEKGLYSSLSGGNVPQHRFLFCSVILNVSVRRGYYPMAQKKTAKKGKIRAKPKLKAKVTKKPKKAKAKSPSKIKQKSAKVTNIPDSEPQMPKSPLITKQKVEDTVYAVAGENGVKVVGFLGERQNVSEFIIADKLKLDMQTIRNTLYKLHTYNVATYIRKKDRQKGWYISYWTFNKKRIRELVEDMKKMQLERLRERLQKEEDNKGIFFICSKTCAKLDFDQATEFGFKCPECGELMLQQENVRTIANLKERIKEIESTIVKV